MTDLNDSMYLSPSTRFEPRYFAGRILNVSWELKKKGYAEKTIKGYSKRLRMLSKSANLDNPESVKFFIANQTGWENACKESCVNAYIHYAKKHSSWEKPIYKRN